MTKKGYIRCVDAVQVDYKALRIIGSRDIRQAASQPGTRRRLKIAQFDQFVRRAQQILTVRRQLTSINSFGDDDVEVAKIALNTGSPDGGDCLIHAQMTCLLC
jgi:hypothetical protein